MVDYVKLKKTFATEPASVRRALQKEAEKNKFATAEAWIAHQARRQTEYAAEKGVATFAEARKVTAKEREQRQEASKKEAEALAAERAAKPRTQISSTTLPPKQDVAPVRETIQLQRKEPEKTGISKLREEDSVVGSLVRAATDWRTTVALVGTLATVAGGAAIIAGAGAKGGTAVISASVSAHARSAATGKLVPLGTAAAQRAIVGKPAASKVGLLFKAGQNVASNTKTRALTTSTLTKAGMSVGVAALVATSVGTYPFAEFELAEATDKIGIAMFQAAGAGDAEEVARLQEYLEEMVNPSVWDSIASKIPFVNVINNVRKNVAAAQVSAASIVKSSQKKLETAKAKAEEPTFAEEREAADIEAFERKREFAAEETKRFKKIEEERKEAKKIEREEDKAYFDDIVKEKRETELQDRADDEEYWKNIDDARKEAKEIERDEETVFWDDLAEKRKADKDAERAADDVYWESIYAANTKRKADDRAADEAYWAEIKGENLDDEEKKMLEEWNKGKSALNFKWLGL